MDEDAWIERLLWAGVLLGLVSLLGGCFSSSDAVWQWSFLGVGIGLICVFVLMARSLDN